MERFYYDKMRHTTDIKYMPAQDMRHVRHVHRGTTLIYEVEGRTCITTMMTTSPERAVEIARRERYMPEDAEIKGWTEYYVEQHGVALTGDQKAQRHAYYMRNREEVISRVRAYHEKHREEHNAKARARYAEQKAKMKERME